MKVLFIFGTRPEAVKMVPLIKELENDAFFIVKTCITAQHREMLDQVLEGFNVKPDYDLNIMKQNQTLADITLNSLKLIDDVIKEVQPDIVLVHGDTTTTFVASLSAFYNQVKVGHVEAGLRSFDKYSPFPEEVNRKLTDVIADIYFAPTVTTKINLLNEGIQEDKVFITGNTAIDMLKYTIDENYTHELFDWVGDSRLLFLTAHRRENLGEPMRNIFRAINDITLEFDDVKVIYPIHFNPKVREVADEILSDNDKVKIIPPLDVFDTHNFINNSYIVLTDSGGIQEEAPSLNKPVLVLREKTERPEGVEAGTLKLVGTSTADIYNNAKALLNDSTIYNKMANASNPFGDGTASQQIAEALKNFK